ncbi:hypothetical protein BDW75DRAFT_121172 [Aspergillus navahoensis]
MAQLSEAVQGWETASRDGPGCGGKARRTEKEKREEESQRKVWIGDQSLVDRWCDEGIYGWKLHLHRTVAMSLTVQPTESQTSITGLCHKGACPINFAMQEYFNKVKYSECFSITFWSSKSRLSIFLTASTANQYILLLSYEIRAPAFAAFDASPDAYPTGFSFSSVAHPAT